MREELRFASVGGQRFYELCPSPSLGEHQHPTHVPAWALAAGQKAPVAGTFNVYIPPKVGIASIGHCIAALNLPARVWSGRAHSTLRRGSRWPENVCVPDKSPNARCDRPVVPQRLQLCDARDPKLGGRRSRGACWLAPAPTSAPARGRGPGRSSGQPSHPSPV